MKKHIALAAVFVSAFLLVGTAEAQSPITETFDTYSSAPWNTFGGSARNFEFTDGTSGECVAGGCIVGTGSNRFTAPRIYKESGVDHLSGAFTVYAKAKLGSPSAPDPIIGLCKGTNTGCSDGLRLDLGGIPHDNAWHQYLTMWRQGASDLEACSLQDSLNQGDCSWMGSGFGLGTAIDGVALWSALGFSSDHGGNLWYDELHPAVMLDLTSSVPLLSTVSTIPVEAKFSTPVSGFALSDIVVDNGTASNLTEVSADTYTFDVVPTTDGLVIVNVSAGAAEDADGNPSVSAAPLKRTIDRIAPALIITSGPVEGSVTNVKSATFTFSADAPTVCAIDGGELAPCSNSYSATGLESGTHIFTVVATDEASNSTTRTRSWSVDAASPILAEVAIELTTSDTTPEYKFSSSKAGTIIYGGACTSTTTAAVPGDNSIVFSELAFGTYSDCTITVVDSLGNVSDPLLVSSFTITQITQPSTEPTDKEQCKNNGWREFVNPSFKNQGDCVSFVATKGKNPPSGN